MIGRKSLMDGIGKVQSEQAWMQQQIQQVQTAGAKQAASTFGAQTSGKAKEAGKDKEAKHVSEEGGDTVSLGEIQSQDIYQAQMGIMQEKIKDEKLDEEEEKDASVSLWEEGRPEEQVHDTGKGEEHPTVEAENRVDTEAVLSRDVTKLADDVPEEIRKAARAIVENQIDPATSQPAKSLREMKPIPERGLLELLPESRASIAEIHDSENGPVSVLEESPAE
jgi:hypothetical protein